MRRSSIYRTICLTLGLALMLSLVACGGSPKTNPGTKAGQPLDPQGNWLITLNGSTTLALAGQLLEVNIPNVTSHDLAEVRSASTNNVCGAGNFAASGSASGVDSITLTITQSQPQGTTTPNANLTLTGTINPDQAHMSGNYTTNQPGSCISSSGTWTAQLLPAVTGTWTGTLQNPLHTITVSATLTENTDQTSPSMGQVTGTITLTDSTCADLNQTVLTVGGGNPPIIHVAEGMGGVTATNAAGISLEIFGTVSPVDGKTYTPVTFIVHGGQCNGQNYGNSNTLTRP